MAADGASPAIEGAVLAFDFGLKHIGVAAGQTITRTASGLTTLAAREGQAGLGEPSADLSAEWRPIRLIVGLPLNMDDSESEMSERARAFAAKLGISDRRAGGNGGRAPDQSGSLRMHRAIRPTPRPRR